MTNSKIALVQDDPWLEPYSKNIEDRLSNYLEHRKIIDQEYGSLENYASSYKLFGFNYSNDEKG